MPAYESSTIAQLLCLEDLPINFAKLVGDLDAVLERLRTVPHKVTWDCDDVAVFDLPGTRIVLAWTDVHGREISGVLTLSVGPSPLPSPPSLKPEFRALCHRLVEQVQLRVPAEAVLWHELACHITPEWVDILVDALPDHLPLPERSRDRFARKKPSFAASGMMPSTHSAFDSRMASSAADPARQHMDELDMMRIRAALYADEPDRLSVPMRLAVHAMNATLIMVWLPLGAVAMTHGLVKGEDMRLASRLMVLTGSVTALAQTPLGQQIAALASI